jgi:hypothetical protein
VAVRGRWPLVGISAAQLGLGLLGLRVALRDGEPSDVRIIRLSADRLAERQWITATALSAPGVMLVAQGVFTAALATRPSGSAARGLGVLGSIMSFGYPVEAGFPRAIRHPDAERTPILLGGFVLAVAMAVLGPRAARDR